MSNSVTAISLHECRISKRGKGAKGSVEVKTFGKPIVEKDAIVSKEWDYSELEKVSTPELIEAIENQKIGSLNYILAIGADYLLKRSSIQAQGTQSMLQFEIMKRGLAVNRDEAKAIASSMYTAKLNLAKNGIEMSYDDLMTAREKQMRKEGKEIKPLENENEQEENENDDE